MCKKSKKNSRKQKLEKLDCIYRDIKENMTKEEIKKKYQILTDNEFNDIIDNIIALV